MQCSEWLIWQKVHKIDFSKNEQKEPWFLEINPNGRIPAITDKFSDGKEIRVFESGAIMQYLVDRYDPEHKLSYPRDSREYWETTSWVGSLVSDPADGDFAQHLQS